MSFSSGLTSLREAPIAPIPLYPSVNQWSDDIRREVEEFYKVRDGLRTEIAQLQMQIAKDRDTAKSGTELKRLKIQKGIILSQIKELLAVTETLTGKKTTLLADLDAYGQERTGDLVDLSRRISHELGDVSEGLTRKSSRLSEEEALLTEMAAYYGELARIVEVSASYNATQRLELDKRLKDAAKRADALVLGEKETKRLLGEASRKHREADARIEEIDSISLWFEKTADRERTTLELLKTSTDRDKKDMAAQQESFIKQREDLARRERRIADKEATLVRSAAEIDAKAKRLGLVI